MSDMAALREQYQDKFGKKPFHGWNEEQLTAKLAEDAPEPVPTVPMIEVQLKRSHWIGEDRHDAPERIMVTLDEALRLIENGVAGRTDPLKAA